MLSWPLFSVSAENQFVIYAQRFFGAFFLVLPFWIILAGLNFYFLSHYFGGLKSSIATKTIYQRPDSLSFDCLEMLSKAEKLGDLSKGFFATSFGKETAFRLGLSEQDLKNFFASRKNPKKLSEVKIEISQEEPTMILPRHLARNIFQADEELSSFLLEQKIQEKEFIGAVLWVQQTERMRDYSMRSWSRDNLGRIPGLAKDWAFGETYTLEKYGQEATSKQGALTAVRSIHKEKIVKQVEQILAKSGEANALIVAEKGIGLEEIITLLGEKIQTGRALAPLHHKKIFILNTAILGTNIDNRQNFETEVVKIFNNSAKAGNIVLVLENLPAFVNNGRSLGANPLELVDPFLSSNVLQVIATSTPDEYYKSMKQNSVIRNRFDTLLIKEPEKAEIVQILEIEAMREEAKNRNKIFFTFQAIKEVEEAASRYISGGVMPDKALDLLRELVSYSLSKGNQIITKADVSDFVETKTGIPQGNVKEEERDKLHLLEETLSKQVIGQEKAIKAVADTMRRVRANLHDQNRPMGSFLFLGPTGVGKTETAKALARVFFDSENLGRLDMSEYSDEGGLSRLIGTFEAGKPGILSMLVENNPYGVLLIDEFEKANPGVINLFLQILDEGTFSNANGKKVNARNLIIIATSNAGSNFIWENHDRARTENKFKEELIDVVIKENIYSPELLNRFDNIIAFAPLLERELTQIARLKLEGLAKKIKDSQGLILVVNDSLVQAVVKAGFDPKFGARPMNRAIQEEVERRVAEKILLSPTKPGSVIEFTEEDFK